MESIMQMSPFHGLNVSTQFFSLLAAHRVFSTDICKIPGQESGLFALEIHKVTQTVSVPNTDELVHTHPVLLIHFTVQNKI